MSIKLVAVDIDGTLLNSENQVTPGVAQAVKEARAAGVKFVIATGRPIAGVQNLLEELDLRHPDNYVITFNGGLVQDTSTEEDIIREPLSYEDYLDIEFLSRKLGVHMHAISKEGIYTANRNMPFRGAVNSAPQFGDRKSYQMDPANRLEAMREIELDIAEGADIIMIKPALSYLDIVRETRDRYELPLAVYNVSGEYAMVKSAAAAGLIDEERLVMETMLSMKRAGAKIIITYHALDVARWLTK